MRKAIILNNIRQASNGQLIALQDELQEMKRIKARCKRDLNVVKKALAKVIGERERRALS